MILHRKRPSIWTLTTIFFLLFSLPATTPVPAQEEEETEAPQKPRTASVYDYDDQSRLIRNGVQVPLVSDMPLEANDTFKTGNGGDISLVFYGFAGTRLGSSSECVVVSKTESSVSLQLKEGTILVNMRELSRASRFEISTALATVIVKGTQFWIKAFTGPDRKKVTTVAAQQGSVFVAMKNSSVTLTVPEGYSVDITEDVYIPSLRSHTHAESEILEKAAAVIISV